MKFFSVFSFLFITTLIDAKEIARESKACVQDHLCLKWFVWDETQCRCVDSIDCDERGLVKNCKWGEKWDRTICECYKPFPVRQRYMCPKGEYFCTTCNRCKEIKKECLLEPKHCYEYEVYDESICRCVVKEETCIQKYECIDGYVFDFNKCICVKN